MSIEGFQKESEFAIDNEKIPCYGIKLTIEQYELVKDSEADFLTIDGRKLFQIRNKDGNTDGYVMFILFRK